MNERQYEVKLRRKIRARFPGCHIMKNDARGTQGIPDLLILFNNRWAMLEVKIDGVSTKQPNQDYYVEHFNHMSFASFINPNTEEEVLNALQSAFEFEGSTRVS
jgi:hypothetical protein